MKKFLAIGALTLALTASAAASVTAIAVSHERQTAETAIELSVDAAVLRQEAEAARSRKFNAD